MSRGLLLVAGAGLALFGAFILALGVVGLATGGADGAITSDAGPLTAPGSAVVIPPEVVSGRAGEDGATIRVDVRALDPGARVFAGVGPRTAVDAYLAGADTSTLEDVGLSPLDPVLSRAPGGAVPPPPPAGVPWSARVTAGHDVPAALTWESAAGNPRIVLMDAAGGAGGVRAEVRFTVDAPYLSTLWTVLAVAGGVVLLGGLLLLGVGGIAILAARASSPSGGG